MWERMWVWKSEYSLDQLRELKKVSLLALQWAVEKVAQMVVQKGIYLVYLRESWSDLLSVTMLGYQ
jgi:hypothetical protein